MKRVTWRSIRVNRAATPWLITRFLDPEATFLLVDAVEVAGLDDAPYAVQNAREPGRQR
jgi:hypothetical protein